jgi:hypothetical protein
VTGFTADSGYVITKLLLWSTFMCDASACCALRFEVKCVFPRHQVAHVTFSRRSATVSHCGT